LAYAVGAAPDFPTLFDVKAELPGEEPVAVPVPVADRFVASDVIAPEAEIPVGPAI